MTKDELVTRLETGERGHFAMQPDDAADLIIQELLSDLPDDRKVIIREVISSWGLAYGGDVADGVASSFHE